MKLLTKLGIIAVSMAFSLNSYAKEDALQGNFDAQRAATLIQEIKDVKSGKSDLIKTGREYTHMLWEAGKYFGQLKSDDAQVLSEIQAEPSGFYDYYESESGFFKIYYQWEGEDAVDNTDANENGTPDVVERYANYFDHAREKYTSFGMLMPYTKLNNKNVYNVYIADSYCESSVLGYTSPNVSSYGQMVVPSHIVVREDYSPFSWGKPAGYTDSSAAQITIAHEFFHACQMMIAYSNMSMFTMEGGAVWSEQFVYTDDEDPYDYISGFTRNASLGLNFSPREEYNPDNANYTFPYGAWIYFEYLTSMYGNEIVKEIYDALFENTEIKAYNKALKKYETSFSESAKYFYTAIPFFPNDEAQKPYFFRYGDRMRAHSNYPFLFPTSAIETAYTTESNTPRTFDSKTFKDTRQRLNRLSAHYYKIRTDRGASITIDPYTAKDSLSVIVLQYQDRADNANNFKVTSVDAYAGAETTMHFDYDPNLPNMYVIVYNNGLRYLKDEASYNYEVNTAYYTMTYQPDDNTVSVEDEITTRDFTIRNIAPMPATENSVLNLMVAAPTMLNYTIYNINGQKVVSDSFLASAGENAQNLNLNNLQAGSYFIEINNGVKSEKINFIKK